MAYNRQLASHSQASFTVLRTIHTKRLLRLNGLGNFSRNDNNMFIIIQNERMIEFALPGVQF